MNSISFNSISDLQDYKRTLNLSSDIALTQYLNSIYSNLIQREGNLFRKSFSYRKHRNDLIDSTSTRKHLLLKKSSLAKLNLKHGISLKTFLEYMNLQELIGERLFNYFNISRLNALIKSEFISGLKKLYYSGIPELIKLTFSLCDFNDDGKIYKSDMKLILVYIPSPSEITQKMKIKQIEQIMNSFFEEKCPNQEKDKEPEIDFELYSKYVNEYDEKTNPNVLLNDFDNNAPFFYFITILSYLFLECPFTIKNINYFSPSNKTYKLIVKKNDKVNKGRNLLMPSIKKNLIDGGKEVVGLMTNFNDKNTHRLDAISKIGKKNLFPPKRSLSQKIIIQNKNSNKPNPKSISDKVLKESERERDFIIAKDKEKEEKKYNKVMKDINSFKKKVQIHQKYASPYQRNVFQEISYSPFLSSMFTKNSTKDTNNTNSNKNSTKDQKSPEDNVKSKLPLIQKEKMTPLSVGFRFKKPDKDFKEPSEFVLCNSSESEDSQKNLEPIIDNSKKDLISAYCYKTTEETNSLLNSKVINKCYAVLSGKEILFFKNESKTDFQDLWYIYKTHITMGIESINNTKYFSLNINFFHCNEINKLYFSKENDCQNFAKKIKTAIHDFSLDDFYELGEQIGQGTFANVYKCTNKFSKNLYAVKIINKKGLTQNDSELIHQEKSYLNLIKHPNIIGLKDYFEDRNFMYLVTEYCPGGDLITFIEKNPNISEKKAAKIIRKIAEGIKYLNIFGIVHRDIKPENILFSEENDIKSLKIIDLGVCKTLTYGQMASEPIGTNGYISPEIYLNKEYSFKTDIWSLGIILYLLITQGLLPFDNENMDDKVIGKKVIYLQQEYPDQYFGKCSKSLVNLLDKMLEKNMEKRIDINSLVKDSWFNIIKKQG